VIGRHGTRPHGRTQMVALQRQGHVGEATWCSARASHRREGGCRAYRCPADRSRLPARPPQGDDWCRAARLGRSARAVSQIEVVGPLGEDVPGTRFGDGLPGCRVWSFQLPRQRPLRGGPAWRPTCRPWIRSSPLKWPDVLGPKGGAVSVGLTKIQWCQAEVAARTAPGRKRS